MMKEKSKIGYYWWKYTAILCLLETILFSIFTILLSSLELRKGSSIPGSDRSRYIILISGLSFMLLAYFVMVSLVCVVGYLLQRPESRNQVSPLQEPTRGQHVDD